MRTEAFICGLRTTAFTRGPIMTDYLQEEVQWLKVLFMIQQSYAIRS